MTDPLTLLTPTGARPEAFARCVELMRAQEYTGPVRWVVVDDGPDPMPVPVVLGWEIIVLRPAVPWRPGQNTQARNLAAGLPFAGDRLLIIEDDDEYAPWWLVWCDDKLVDHDLIGEAPSLYVHRGNGARHDCGNRSHASLCATAMTRSIYPLFADILRRQDKVIDITLWRLADPARAKIYDRAGGVTGIKGWPGRPGIGMGHRL